MELAPEAVRCVDCYLAYSYMDCQGGEMYLFVLFICLILKQVNMCLAVSVVKLRETYDI